MKQIMINNAYPVISRLCTIKLPIKKARALYYMAADLKKHFDFAMNEERKLISQFDGKLNSNGTISFASADMFSGFEEAIEDLNNSIVDWDYECIVLTEDDIGDQRISASEIENLEGLVIFE